MNKAFRVQIKDASEKLDQLKKAEMMIQEARDILYSLSNIDLELVKTEEPSAVTDSSTK